MIEVIDVSCSSDQLLFKLGEIKQQTQKKSMSMTTPVLCEHSKQAVTGKAGGSRTLASYQMITT